MDWLQIDWKGPYSLRVAPKTKVAEHFGVYAIYKREPRIKKLLYIGRTYEQDFERRLAQHRRDWLDDRYESKDLCIHFGILIPPPETRISFERVADVEELLISCYVPPHNTASKSGYSGRDLLLLNTGTRGSIDVLIGAGVGVDLKGLLLKIGRLK